MPPGKLFLRINPFAMDSLKPSAPGPRLLEEIITSVAEASLMKTMLILLFVALPVLAQDDAAKARMAAGCGPNEVNFEVKTAKKQHPSGRPEAGKALVYVFSNTAGDNAKLVVGAAVIRFGLDGTWVGATELKSYFFFQVDPGEHRLCTSWQSSLKSRNAVSVAKSFTAEAGKVYYFALETSNHPQPGKAEKLVAVDPAEGQLFVASSAYSTFHEKK